MAESIIVNNNPVNFQTRINISAYNALNNYYTFPKDGYVMLVADGAIGNQAIARNLNGDAIASAKTAITNTSFSQTFMVKAGMKLFFYFADSSVSFAWYYPLD